MSTARTHKHEYGRADETGRHRPGGLRAAVLADLADLADYDHPALLAVARLAAAVCGTPMSAVTLVQEHRQVFAAGVGLGLSELSLESSFCAVAVLTPDTPLLVEDLAADPRFADNPFVTGGALLSYFGYPLVTGDGVALGTVCTLDSRPRSLTPAQHEQLAELATVTVELLEARRTSRELSRAAERTEAARAGEQQALEQLSLVFERSAQGMFLVQTPGTVVRANAAFAALLGREAADLVGVHAGSLTYPDDRATDQWYADLARATNAGAPTPGRPSGAAGGPGNPERAGTGTMIAEKRFLHADGSAVPAVTSTAMVATDTPGRVLTLSTVESVAERRAAETRMLEVQSAVDGIIGLDATGRVTSWNRGAERMFGHAAADVLGGTLELIIPVELQAAHRAGIERLAGGGTPALLEQTLQLPAVRAGGQRLLVELTLSRWEQHGRVGYSGIVRDVTRRHAAQQRADLLAFAARTANDAATFAEAAAVILTEVGARLGCTHAIAWSRPGPTGTPAPAVWWVSNHKHALGESCPLRRGAAGGRRPDPVRLPLDGTVRERTPTDLRRTAVATAVDSCRLGNFLTVPVLAGGAVAANLGFGLPRAEASADPGLADSQLADPELADPELADPQLADALRQVGVLLGRVCEREATAAERDHQATHDPLTDLANRRQLLTEISHAQQALADGTLQGGVAVLLIDLDRFKLVNESLGHGAGDVVLQEVTRRLRDTASPADTVGRLGGDEFVLIVRDLPAPDPGSGLDPALARAQHVLTALRGTTEVAGHRVPLRASIGVVTLTREHGRVPELPASVLRDADSALLLAKRRGKDRVEAFTPGLRFDAATRLTDENALSTAIANDALQVFYQPVIDLPTGRAVGAEALVRWPRPGHGMVPPDVFIPLAEESGLIVELGRWVLSRACRDAASWASTAPGLADAPVNVNVSARQLAHPQFLDHVQEALDTSGLPARRLVVEITESVLVADEQTKQVLHALRNLGIRLALDDFGTGYSSLSYVQQLPVDILKIDKSFVDLITGPGQGTAFTEVVLKLAAAMGLDTTAEGVETPAQAAALALLGCHHGQGWTWARAVPLHDLQAALPQRTAT